MKKNTSNNLSAEGKEIFLMKVLEYIKTASTIEEQGDLINARRI